MKWKVVREGLTSKTCGLARVGQSELRAEVASPEVLNESVAFLDYVAGYVVSTGKRIRDGETVNYGYWLVKFIQSGDALEGWEYTAGATDFVRGVTLTVTYWRDQHATCARYQANFQPPRGDQFVAISLGVLEGDRVVYGVRYPSPEHMSGWWLTTDRYDGNVKSLKITHAYHVTSARPDLSHLIALPYGFCFDLSEGERVWFDEGALTQNL